MNLLTRLNFALGVAFFVALLAAPAAGAAGTYYATPGGSGTTCTTGDLCSLATAKGKADADPGSTLLLEPGSYTLAGSISFNGTYTVAPAVPGTRPEIKSVGGFNVSVFGAVTLQDIRIDMSGMTGSSESALAFQSRGAALRVQIVAAGSNFPIGVLLKEGSTLADSTVWVQSANGRAIVGGSTGGTIRNVTAIATGTSSRGLAADGNFSGAGITQTVDLQNSILRGTLTDLIAANGTAADPVIVRSQNSDYVTPSQTPPNSVITDLGGNTVAAPLFASAATGDFHQVAGSPTIDQGAVVAGLSGLDFDGGARVVNSGSTCTALPDIGADEFPTDTTPASCTPTPPAAQPQVLRKKCKKHKRKHHAIAAKKKCRHKKHR